MKFIKEEFKNYARGKGGKNVYERNENEVPLNKEVFTRICWETGIVDSLLSHNGYSLRVNAFFVWLKRSRYSLWYIARRLGTTPDNITNRLRNRENSTNRNYGNSST